MLTKVVCQICGTEFEYDKKQGYPRKYCSTKCRYQGINDANKPRRKEYLGKMLANQGLSTMGEYCISRLQQDPRFEIDKQSGTCMCCGDSTGMLLYDHNHSTKEYRGAVCYSCNSLLTYRLEDTARLAKIITYLDRV